MSWNACLINKKFGSGRAQRHYIARDQDFQIICPLLQPYPGLGVVPMPIIDGAYRTIDVIADAALHDTRATQAQSRVIGIGALVSRTQVGDNARRGQWWRFFHFKLSVNLYRHLYQTA